MLTLTELEFYISNNKTVKQKIRKGKLSKKKRNPALGRP
jgi:hypothetical protein